MTNDPYDEVSTLHLDRRWFMLVGRYPQPADVVDSDPCDDMLTDQRAYQLIYAAMRHNRPDLRVVVNATYGKSLMPIEPWRIALAYRLFP